MDNVWSVNEFPFQIYDINSQERLESKTSSWSWRKITSWTSVGFALDPFICTVLLIERRKSAETLRSYQSPSYLIFKGPY